MKSRVYRGVAAILISFAAAAFCSEGTSDSAASTRYREEAANGIDTLQKWYNEGNGLYETTGWWNSANAVTVVVDYSRLAKTRRYVWTVANTFHMAQKTSPGFINNFYDDEGWWALAWIDAYDLTHSLQYLHMAQLIFADMASGWDTTTCGGGIWWSKDRTYKNAIANELFLSVAAHLANRVEKHQRAQYETWSQREWTWFTSSGMINDQNLINDGLDSSNASACKNNRKSTWSYNQGVILGGLAEFSDFSKDRNVLIQAARIANSAIRHLTDANGILHDSCEPNCGADGPQFKGIFIRNLVQLNAKSPSAAYKSFAKANADELWNDAQGPNHSFGLVWSGPFDVADASRQSSALDAIIAAAVMNEDHWQSRL